MFREKVKLIVIVIAVGLLASCSVFDKSRRSEERLDGDFGATAFFREVVGNNVSSGSFRIDRVRVIADLESGKQRVSGNLKYHKEGKILFSARAIAGIEVARVYLDKSDVVVIDRLNRIYYEGSTESFLVKYGLTWDDIFILFGDLPAGLKPVGRVVCKEGKSDFVTKRKEITISYSVDCLIHKLLNIEVGNLKDGFIKASYSAIKSEEGSSFPGEVLIQDNRGRVGVELYYERFGKYDGNFGKPGRPGGYDLEKLL